METIRLLLFTALRTANISRRQLATIWVIPAVALARLAHGWLATRYR